MLGFIKAERVTSTEYNAVQCASPIHFDGANIHAFYTIYPQRDISVMMPSCSCVRPQRWVVLEKFIDFSNRFHTV